MWTKKTPRTRNLKVKIIIMKKFEKKKEKIEGETEKRKKREITMITVG